MSLADPHKAYLLRKAMHYFNTQRQYREEAHGKPLIEVGWRVVSEGWNSIYLTVRAAGLLPRWRAVLPMQQFSLRLSCISAA